MTGEITLEQKWKVKGEEREKKKAKGREQTGWALEGHQGGIDTGQVDSQGEESSISRLAGVAMVTELGRDVIMPWLIQTWQAPITPPLERERERGWG